MSGDPLCDAIGRLSEAEVLCLGDVMLDQFIYGKVERISPEAPIPVLFVTHETNALGGLGNVARNLSSLGAKCHVVSAIGDDPAGAMVRELLKELPGCEAKLVINPKSGTIIKTRIVGGNQQIVRVDRESRGALSEALANEMAQLVLNEHSARIVALSDYGKGVLGHRETLKNIIKNARSAGRTVIVDPKGTDFTRYAGASILTPNRSELEAAARMPVRSLDDAIAAARSLIQSCSVDCVLATLSEAGMLIVPAQGSPEHLPAEALEVFDVSGAGDTVVATLSAGLSIGMDLRDAAQLANTAAGIVVGKIGTASVRADELLHAVRRQEGRQAEAKVASWEEAEELVARWRREGLRVGFTNGCFDLLHPGHVTLLAKARATVDRLIVGLNSDASVSKLKGPTRPIQKEMARGIVLASLKSVDAVVIFGEDTPLKLLELLRPDVLVKGGDYTIKTIVGADLVTGYGGSVAVIDLVPEQSTSRLVERSQQ